MTASDVESDFLARRVGSSPTGTALVDDSDGRAWTYRELDSVVDRVAARFAESLGDRGPTSGPDTGKTQGETAGARRVGLLLSPRPAVTILFYAAMRLGSSTVGLNTRVDRDTLREQIERSGCSILFGERETVETLRSVVDSDTRWMQDGDVHSVDEDEFVELTEPRTQSSSQTDRATNSPTDHPTDSQTDYATDSQTDRATDLDPSETVLVLFTSGTTGEPTGVRLTARNLAASATASAYRLGVSPGDRWLGCLPVYHMGGFSPIVRSVIHGTRLVFQREFDAARTRDALEQHEITHVSLVPTQLTRLLDELEQPGDGPALESLRTVLLGGAPATRPLLERAWSAGLPVHPTYGLTETASQVATALPEQARRYPGTVGFPLFGTEVSVLGDGGEVGPEERGELVVSGPTVSPGYLDAAITDDAFGERGFHTGDVGYRDEDGRIWVVGRVDDVINTGGELVAPETVREVLQNHPSVVAAAVVGVDDSEWGERVAALVQCDSDSLSAADLRRYCSERVAEFATPKTIVFGENIPRTHSGTVDREAVREVLERSGHRD